MGAKEGLAHLVLATISPEMWYSPQPHRLAHPPYSVIIAGGTAQSIPITKQGLFSKIS